MSFIQFYCNFCASYIPIRSWYAFKIHLNTKRHSRLALKQAKKYLRNYLEYFPTNKSKLSEMTEQMEVEKIAELQHNWQVKLLEIITEDLERKRRSIKTPEGEPNDSYCLLCIPCNKEFESFADGMEHRTSQRHVINCRDVGCEEFKLTFPLVESEESEEEEEEKVSTPPKVLKVRSKTPSPLAVSVNVPVEVEL